MEYSQVITFCVVSWVGGWWGGIACAIWFGLWISRSREPERVDRRETWRQIYSRRDET